MSASLASCRTSSHPSSTIGAITIASTPWLMKLRTAAIWAAVRVDALVDEAADRGDLGRGVVVGRVEDQVVAVVLRERLLHVLRVGAAPAGLGAGLREA